MADGTDAADRSLRGPGRIGRVTGSLRVRIVTATVLVLALALGAVAVLVRQELTSRLDARIERALVREAEELRRLAAGTDPGTGEPFGADAAAVLATFGALNVPDPGEAFYAVGEERVQGRSEGAPDGPVADPARLAHWSALTTTERTDIDTADGEARVLAVPLLAEEVSQGTLLVVVFPAEERAEVGDTVRGVVAVGAAVVVLAALLAWVLAGRVLRPVRDLTRTAVRVGGAESAGVRAPVTGPDELVRLSAAVNGMLDRLDAERADERAVVEEVVRQLRRRVAVVRGELEQLGGDPEGRTVASVADELDRVDRQLADLVVLAEEDGPELLHAGLVDVGDLVAGVLVQVRTLGDRRWTSEEVPPAGSVWLRADRERLTQALVDLAAHAVERTSPGDEVVVGARVVANDVWLWVRDHADPAVGDGSTAERDVRVEPSSVRRTTASSLGFAVAEVIARAHRGRVRVDDAPDGGVLVTLVLPRTADDHPGGDEAEAGAAAGSGHRHPPGAASANGE